MVRPSITCLLAKNPRLNNSQTYFRSRKRWPQHPPHFVQQVNNTYCIVRPSRRCGWYKTPRDGVIMHSSWTLRLNVCFSWSTLYQSDCVVFPYRLLLLIFPYLASSPLSRRRMGSDECLDTMLHSGKSQSWNLTSTILCCCLSLRVIISFEIVKSSAASVYAIFLSSLTGFLGDVQCEPVQN